MTTTTVTTTTTTVTTTSVTTTSTTPTTLYIIGNGFDLHHDLKTSYSKFGLFLKKNDKDIYDNLIKYFGFNELDENDSESLKSILWSEFEINLANFEAVKVLKKLNKHLPNIASKNFSDGDWVDISNKANKIVKKITIKLRSAFQEFISLVLYPDSSNTLLKLENNAYYFNFNYTDTLEYYYNIPANLITHIHNKASGKSKLILGHGLNPNDIKLFNPEDAIPADSSIEEIQDIKDQIINGSHVSIEQGQYALKKYFFKSHKGTAEIIQKNLETFNKFTSVDTVYVLGHSLGEVDKKYFEKILTKVHSNSTWIVSYYNDCEAGAFRQKLINYGVLPANIQLIRLDELIAKG